MYASANKGKEAIIFGNDSIVIQKFISGIVGGRTLDLESWKQSVVPAGTIIIKTSTGVYKPCPIVALLQGENPLLNDNGEQVYGYDALPSGASYVGVLYRSIRKVDATASIMFDGVVNEEVLPYVMSADTKTAFVAAVPHIIFNKDEVA